MVGRWMGSLGCPAAPKIGWLGFFAKDMNLGSDLLLFGQRCCGRVWRPGLVVAVQLGCGVVHNARKR